MKLPAQLERYFLSRRAFLGVVLVNSACGGGEGADASEGPTQTAQSAPSLPIAPSTATGPAPTSIYSPPVGQRANVNLNSASDIDYDLVTNLPQAQRWWNGYSRANSFAGMIGYSGSIWAPEYSAHGAIIVKGGGHGYNIGQHCYPFNFSTFKWEQVGAPRNFPANLEWAGWTDYAAAGNWSASVDRRTVSPPWYDYNHNGSYIKLDEHSYLQTAYLSPREGGGTRGSLLLPQTTFHQGPETADPRTGVSLYWAPHTFDLSNGTMARSAAAPYGAWVGYSGTVAVKDSSRSRLWYLINGGSVAYYHDLSAGPPFTRVTHRIQKRSGGNMTWCVVKNASWLYVPEADCFVGFYPQNSNEAPPAIVNGNLGVQILKMSASGFPVDQERDAAVGARPMPKGGLMIGAAWVPGSVVGGVGKFYLYEGYGEPYCHTLTPSSLEFATCSWTWGREQFGNAHAGADPVYRQAFSAGEAQVNAPMGKFVYVPALQSLAWHDGPATRARCYDGVTRGGIVQLWRPPGAPI
ncbi:MAG: hypothetical protein J0L57_01535 [Burkholderiales bacterium]|nr:hypothetical protein [Burkholderiales bacterium]